MPMYDFRCRNFSFNILTLKPECELASKNKAFEKIVASHDSPNPPCPACGAPGERILFSGNAATFRWGKGGGWN